MSVGLFLNPVGQRRVAFQAVCAEQFERLFLADGTEQASALLAQQEVDLLVIDLERFDRSFDVDALGQLIVQRGSARTLVLCPFESAGWLPVLMAFGPISYAISPLPDGDLCKLLGAEGEATGPNEGERCSTPAPGCNRSWRRWTTWINWPSACARRWPACPAWSTRHCFTCATWAN